MVVVARVVLVLVIADQLSKHVVLALLRPGDETRRHLVSQYRARF
jgi:lipoprotein signal peptidase